MLSHRSSPAMLAAAIAIAIALATRDLPGQRPQPDRGAWKLDPYTRGDPDAMARAGYVSFGPFPFGDDHDTARIEHVLGDGVRLRWVETAHFRIGSSLPAYKITHDKEERAKIRGELDRLEKRLPRVKPGVKTLDPWLRLHLFAQRFEDTYADFCDRLGVGPEDFPSQRGELVRGRYMGEGPYLGQPAKYTVLLFEKKSTFGHYLSNFLRMECPGSLRHNFIDTGSLLYATCTEFAGGTLQIDTALHCEAVFNCVHSLVDGYRFYWHSVPHWFRQGLAHWYLRRISPRYNVFAETTQFDNDPTRQWNWAPRVRARAKFDYFPRAAELLRWTAEDEKDLTDSMMVWSRVDYLMSLGNGGLRVYLDVMTDRFEAPAPPSRERILARQEGALRKAWDLDEASFDLRWRRWVLEQYPER